MAQAPADWTTVTVPEIWKRPPAGIDNLSWYRGFILSPAGWKGKDLELFVEPTDAAHEVYFNGKLIGRAGAFPPFFRSGLGGADRFFVPADSVRYGRPNVVAIRVCNVEGRSGFNVGAPVLFGEKAAVRMAGAWQFRPGDHASWAVFDNDQAPQDVSLFAQLDDAAEVAAALKRLDDAGPQSPAQSLAQFTVPDDLEVELALSEPHVQQPLSIKWDPRGRLWVTQFIQYPDPAGLTMVSRDKHLRSVYDKVPPPPPHHIRGLDRITLHEDTDGDGTFDKHGTFVDGLSLTSSFAFDKDGLWVLQPPYLLFYPDRNHDDVPDGDPTVHLEGFGIEDSHSIANSLRWGPDGWLYGAQGSTVTGSIRRPGEANAIHSLGQCIWRYHPSTQRYEIFAEGGGNTFGVEIDAHGRIYSGHNGGNTRGFHYVQGGYYQKGFDKHGALSNPYAFGFFPHMQHADVPRFTHTFVIYEGATGAASTSGLPAKYQGNLFAVAPLQGQLVRSEISAAGSSRKTRDIDFPLTTKDTWFRPVDIQVGPDGAIYVCDFYEQRIDHASHYQGRIDRERGRIWRLKQKKGAPHQPFDLTRATTYELIDRLQDHNRWFRQTALLALSWRKPADAAPELLHRLKNTTDDSCVAFLWALQQLDGLTEPVALQLLDHPNPYVRLWTVRLLCDQKQVSMPIAESLMVLAANDPHLEVRSQLACSVRRLPASDALPIISRMLPHDADAADIHLPLLLWWAVEALAESNRDELVSLFAEPAQWKHTLVRKHIIERLMRRYASAGSRKDLLACAKLLHYVPDGDTAQVLLSGFEKAFEGRPLTGLPDELIAAIAKVGGGSQALRLRQGDPLALDQSLKVIADARATRSDRLRYVQILAELHPEPATGVLLDVLKPTLDMELQIAVLGALQSYEDPRIGELVVDLLPALSEEARPVAVNLLASRKTWASSLLLAVDAGAIPARSLPLEAVQRLLLYRDDRLAALAQKHFGSVKVATTAEMLAQLDLLKSVLSAGTGNPYEGRKLYLNSCGKCHVLFGEGGHVGPDLTSYKRDDAYMLLMNVVNPSAQIREGFENHVVVTNDGRTLSGFIADQDARVIVLRVTDGRSIVIPRGDIDEMSASAQSLMPEGLLKDLTEQQVRNLFAYLRSTQPLKAR